MGIFARRRLWLGPEWTTANGEMYLTKKVAEMCTRKERIAKTDISAGAVTSLKEN
jgi:hypothetical protein